MASLQVQETSVGKRFLERTLNGIENRGLESVPPVERHGKIRSQFGNCWARNFHLPPFVAGATAVSLGLGLAGATTAIVAACALGAVANSFCVMMGPRRGCPQMVMSRGSFGYFGNYLPAFVGSVLFLGYFTVNEVLGAKAIEALWTVPLLPLVIGIGLISIVLGVVGYDLVQTYSGLTTAVTAVIFVVLLGLGAAHGFGPLLSGHLHGSAFWKVWILQFTISFSLISSWSPYGSDLSRYLPEDTSETKLFWATWSGMFVSSAFVMILGALFVTLAPSVGAIAGIRKGAGSFAYVALLAMLPGAVASTVINLYSGSLSTQAWGLGVNRKWLIAGIGILGVIAGSIGAGSSFFAYFIDFLDIVAYFVTPWIVIVCIDYYIVFDHGRKWPDASAFYTTKYFSGYNWVRLVALLVGIAVSIPFISNTWYTGPIGHELGGADISYFVSAAVAAVVVLAFGRRVPFQTIQAEASLPTDPTTDAHGRS
jgi:NCS1 family nucleobase:cation symporter-1